MAADLQGAALALAQRIDACLQHAGERGRHARCAQALLVDPPARLGDDDGAVVNEHADDLLGSEGVAFGLPIDQPGQRGRHHRQMAQQRPGEQLALRVGQRLQAEQLMLRQALAPARAAVDELRARTHHREKGPRGLGTQLLQRVQRGVVCPLHVVEQQHHGRAVAGGQPAQPQCERRQRAFAQQPRIVAQAHQRRVVAEVDAHQLAEHAAGGSPRSFNHGNRPSSSLLRATSAPSLSAMARRQASSSRSRP